MKFFLILIALVAAAWFAMNRMKKNETAQQMQAAPVKYVQNLQTDVEKAKGAEAAATQAVKATEADVQKAVDAQ